MTTGISSKVTRDLSNSQLIINWTTVSQSVSEVITDFEFSDIQNSILLGNVSRDSYLRGLSDQQAWEFLPVIIYIALLMLFGIIGNLLVLYVHVLKFKPSSTRTFVISLACFDLMSCLIAMPGEILDIRFAYDYPSPISCKLLRAITSFVSIASGITLMAVSFDRYRRVCRPLKLQIGPKKASILVIVASSASMFFSWPLLVLSGDKTVETDIRNVTGYECSVSDEYRKSKFPLIYTICLFLVFMSAFVTMVIAYSLIARKIMKQNIFRRSATLNRNRHRTLSSNQNFESEKPGERIRKISSTSMNNVPIETNQCSDENASDYSIASYPWKLNMTRKHSLLTNKFKRSPDDSRTLKTTMMLFLISLMFLLSFLPHLILKSIQSMNKGFLDDVSSAGNISYNIFVRSFMINSVSNAFIYGFCSPRFRSECRNICKNLVRKRSFSLHSNSFNYV